MSFVDDFFTDAEDNEDDPVEFSEVSGSLSSSQATQLNSQQQPSQQPPVVPGPSTSASDISATTCPYCSKTFGTERGCKTHITRSHKDQASKAVTTPPPLPQNLTQAQTFTCPDCRAVLTTAGGFVKHRASHKLKDAYTRMPEPAQFKEEAFENTVVEILEDILKEPSYGDASKINFVNELLTQKGTENWLHFFTTLCDFTSEMVCKKQVKLLPANQYEDFQKKMNSYLNENDCNLKEKLVNVCQLKISDTLVGRLVFRIATQMLKKVQVWVLQKMHCEREQEISPFIQVMSEQERETFLIYLGDFCRNYYQKRVTKSGQQTQCDCIKSTFVEGHHPISRRDFLDKKNWFSGEENCIVLNHHAVDFFCAIETEIIPSVKVSKDVTTQTVMEEVLESHVLLDHWFYLTNAYMHENESLLFMRDLISVFVRSSLLLEEKKMNRAEARTIRATSVALRTHLQHNYIEKGDDEVE